MNRPNKPNLLDYRNQCNFKDDFWKYIKELEKYCDELEEKSNHMYFIIGEALVENSKCHISDDECFEKIKEQLQEFRR